MGIAGPFENYTRRSPELDAKYFADLATQEKIERFVVGLPVHLSGQESQKSTEARAFGEWLGKVTGVPVEYFDERFTTSEADQILGAAKLTKKQRAGAAGSTGGANHAHRLSGIGRARTGRAGRN